MTLRVAVDATAMLDQPTGIGVFTAALLDGLATRPEVSTRAYATSWRGRSRFRAVIDPVHAPARRPLPARPARALWSRGSWPPIEWWTGPVDVVHGPNFVVPPTRGAAVATVHDLTATRYPEMVEADVLAYPRLISRALERGAWIHTPSAFIATEVTEHFATDRVRAIPNGVAPVPAAPAARGAELAGSDQYLLALGTVEPRKGLPDLVRAFADLAAARGADAIDDAVNLVIAGPDGWGAAALDDALAETSLGRRVRRTGWVDDHDRAALLRGARALAYPSVYEGFGLPPLEAMSVGVPVVCSDAGALPETVGDAALVVPSADRSALAEGIRTVLTDDERRATLVAAGTERVAEFGWDRCVDGLVQLYRDAIDD